MKTQAQRIFALKRWSTTIAFFICTLISIPAFSQCPNLTESNGDFEDFTNCPDHRNGIGGNIPGGSSPFVPGGTYADETVQGWFSPGQDNFHSPDYYNTCAPPPWVSVPVNAIGTETPHSGDGYGGFLPTQEAFETPLDAAMTPGTEYVVVMCVSLGETSASVVENFEVSFSNGPLYQDAAGDFPAGTPSIVVENTDPVLDEFNGWEVICGNYMASGGEQFITIGNISGNITLMPGGPGSIANIGYYFLDDVLVIENNNDPLDVCEGDLQACVIPGATYSWTNLTLGGTTGLTCPTCADPMDNAAAIGSTFAVTITLPSGCSVTNNYTVVANPVVTFGPISDLCSTDPCVLLNPISSPPGGSWSGPGIVNTPPATNLHWFCPDQVPGPGSYLLNYTVTSGGCTSTATTSVTVEDEWPQTTSNTAGGDFGGDIDVDQFGNVYTLGTFFESTEANSSSSTNLIDHNNFEPGMFLIKYDPCGEIVWVVQSKFQVGNPAGASGKAIVVDRARQKIYATGRVESGTEVFTSTIGPSIPVTPPLGSMYIAQYEYTGQLNYVHVVSPVTPGDPGFNPNSITVNPKPTGPLAGRVYVTGNRTAPSDEAFILGLDDTGSALSEANWSPMFSSDMVGDWTLSNGIDADRFNRVYVTGTFKGETQFIPSAGPLGTLVSNIPAVNDAFLFRFRDFGPFVIWTFADDGGMPADQGAEGTSVVVDNNGRAYATGIIKGNGPTIFGETLIPGTSGTFGYVGCFMGPPGTGIWAETIDAIAGSPGAQNYARAYDVDVRGPAIFVTGDFGGSQVLIPTGGLLAPALPGTDHEGVFVSKFQKFSGTPLWVNSTDDDSNLGNIHNSDAIVASRTHPYTYTTGDYLQEMNFNNSTTPSLLASGPGARNVFVIRNRTNNATMGQFRTLEVVEENPVIDQGLEESDAFTFQIFPNPASHELTLEVDLPNENERAELIAYDLMGQIVGRANLMHGRNDVSQIIDGLADGQYLFRVMTNNGQVATQKLILVK